MKDSFVDRVGALIYVVGILLALISVQLITQIAFDGVCRIVTGESISDKPVYSAIFYMVYSVIGSVLFGFLYRILKGGNQKATVKCSAGRIGSLAYLGVGLQLLAYSILNMIYVVFSENEVLKSYDSMMDNLNGSQTYLIFLYTMLFAPIIEEIVFRGVIYEKLRRSFSIKWVIVIQAICFGIFHGNIVQAVYAFILGLALGYVRSQRNSLREVMFLHIVINVAGIFVAPVMLVLLGGIFGKMITYVILLVTSLIITVPWFVINLRRDSVKNEKII